jgi:Putative transposase/Transposase zinc-binding domain
VVQRCTLQDVFVAGFAGLARQRQLHPREIEAARCISQCYTSELGTHVQHCLAGDYSRIQYHACRHRSCPQCADDARQRWLHAQLPRLLPCPHAHIVFTLPHVLLPLWELNRPRLIAALFDAARQALFDLMHDPLHAGLTPGILMSLHTWGRNLSHHPHLHCLVSAGGVDDHGQWKSCSGKWLLPFKPLEVLYRNKFLAAVRSALKYHQLQLPPSTTQAYWHDELGRQQHAHWNVRVCPTYEHGRGVAMYLARYAKGGPLPKSKVLQFDGHHVKLRYRDHRCGKNRWLTLPMQQFIERILWHAPPRGVHTTRHAGLYSTPMREQYASAARHLGVAAATPTATTQPESPCDSSASAHNTKRCPRCGGPLLRHLLLRPNLRSSFLQGLSREISKPEASKPVQSTGPPQTGTALAPTHHQQRGGRCPTSRSS